MRHSSDSAQQPLSLLSSWSHGLTLTLVLATAVTGRSRYPRGSFRHTRCPLQATSTGFVVVAGAGGCVPAHPLKRPRERVGAAGLKSSRRIGAGAARLHECGSAEADKNSENEAAIRTAADGIGPAVADNAGRPPEPAGGSRRRKGRDRNAPDARRLSKAIYSCGSDWERALGLLFDAYPSLQGGRLRRQRRLQPLGRKGRFGCDGRSGADWADRRGATASAPDGISPTPPPRERPPGIVPLGA